MISARFTHRCPDCEWCFEFQAQADEHWCLPRRVLSWLIGLLAGVPA